MLIVYKELFPSIFVFPQPGSANDIYDSITLENTFQTNNTASMNEDIFKRLVEIVDALLIKDVDKDCLEATENGKIIDQDAGMSKDALRIYDNKNMYFPIQKF